MDLEIGYAWNSHAICKVGDGFNAAFGGFDSWFPLLPFLRNELAGEMLQMMWCPLNGMHAQVTVVV